MFFVFVVLSFSAESVFAQGVLVQSQETVAVVQPASPSTIILGERQIDFEKVFEGIEGTFVLYDETESVTLVHNPKRARVRFSPWSTFELPAMVMLLDANVLSSVDQKVRWDAAEYPAHTALPEHLKKEWESDHSLKTAYHGYAVWLFLSQMKKIPQEMVKDYLQRFNYGEIDQTLDNGFWLGKQLKISAIEQIAFLRGLTEQQFKLRDTVEKEIQPVLMIQEGADYRLALKTGSGANEDQAFGWAIGFVERGNRRYFFAMNLDAQDYRTLTEKRTEIVFRVLEQAGLIPLGNKKTDKQN